MFFAVFVSYKMEGFENILIVWTEDEAPQSPVGQLEHS